MTTLAQVYEFITEDDDEGEVCQTIPAEACTDVPRNFFLNAANGAATKLGEQLASPSLVLPWLLDTMGAPLFLTGWLVPVRRAMALLPQLVIAGRIRRFEQRKWFWAGGGAGFGLGFLLMIPAVMLLSPLAAGIAIVLLLGVASIARGVSSVAYKDVLAKTVPMGRRGTLLATRASVAGVLTLAAGALLRLYVSDASSLTPYLILLGVAGTLWFVGVGFALAISEEPGATEGARNPLEEARAGWHLLQEKAGFRRFILARALLLSVRLAIPFYILYARDLIGGAISGLSIFVIATGLAEVLSSPFWGRFSDRDSRAVMVAGGMMSIVVGVGTLALGWLPEGWQTSLVFGVAIFLIGVGKAGVRLGRKTYLVDGAPEANRPTYVAVTNTLIGTITLASGGLGLIAELVSVQALLVTFLVLMAFGVVVAWRMPAAEEMAA